MLSMTLGLALIVGGSLVLSAVFWPDTLRAYFHRPRHTARAVSRRRAREADPIFRQEQWFAEWRKQYPALNGAGGMSVLPDR